MSLRLLLLLGAPLAVLLTGCASGDGEADAPVAGSEPQPVVPEPATTRAAVAVKGAKTPATLVVSPEPSTTVAATLPAAARVMAGRPYPVDVVERVWTDETRPVVDPGGVRSTPTRLLETTVYVPAGTGPFPLVVHGHGLDGHPDKFSQLLGRWSAAGYVVAAPVFPLTNGRTGIGFPGGVSDISEQARDLGFVVDQLLADPELAPLVDPERIGVSGLSLGGASVYGAVGEPCCRDGRFRAAMVENGVAVGGPSFSVGATPFLVFHGDADPIIPYDSAVAFFERLTGPRHFVTLLGGLHAEPFEDWPDPHDDAVAAISIAYWDRYLLDDASATDRLLVAGSVPGLAQIRSAS